MHQRSGQHTCRLRLNVVSRGRGDVSRAEIVSSVPDDLQLRRRDCRENTTKTRTYW